jgi:hypothetical protein
MRQNIGLARAWALVGFAFAVAGCSIHPLPDDVSPETTQRIVLNIRCEAKMAVRQRIAEALERTGDPRLMGIPPEDVARRIQDVHRFDTKLAHKFEKYFGSVIGYDFDFEIDEDNVKTAEAGFLWPFLKGGAFSLDVDAHAKRHRTGHREFKMVETFEKLDLLDCRDYEQPPERRVYPITGSIGMANIMNTFIDLAEQGGGEQEFRDTITFATEFHGDVNPSITLEPIVDTFRLVKASANVSATRTDVHKLIVAIAFPTIDDRAPVHEGHSRSNAGPYGGGDEAQGGRESLHRARRGEGGSRGNDPAHCAGIVLPRRAAFLIRRIGGARGNFGRSARSDRGVARPAGKRRATSSRFRAMENGVTPVSAA